MLWKGQLSWKQYISSKRSRYGIKSNQLCESSSGYIWDFFVYTGKNTEHNVAYRDVPNVGAKAVLTLAHNLFDQGYCISMDNFFTSSHLFDFVYQQNADAVGTLCANSKCLLQELMSKSMKKGEVAAMYKGNLMVLRWRDKKYVHMLNTTHDNSVMEVISR